MISSSHLHLLSRFLFLISSVLDLHFAFFNHRWRWFEDLRCPSFFCPSFVLRLPFSGFPASLSHMYSRCSSFLALESFSSFKISPTLQSSSQLCNGHNHHLLQHKYAWFPIRSTNYMISALFLLSNATNTPNMMRCQAQSTHNSSFRAEDRAKMCELMQK